MHGFESMKYFLITISIILIFRFLLLYSRINLRMKQFRNYEEANGTELYALDFIGLTQLHGREAEWHNVTTDDGYILSIFRILPNSIYHNVSERRRVIYLQHPLGATADIYIFFGPGRSLPYTLSDAGYDVWLGNFRGNSYSRRHRRMSPESSEFWNFSMDEYALLDTPAMFDYILETTEQPNLTYIGHSLGTTTILMLLSRKPEYNDKLNAVVLLAPISYWTTQSPARFFISLLAQSLQLLSPTGIMEFQPQSIVLPEFFRRICLINRITLELCYLPYNLILGNNREQFQLDQTPELLRHYPAGISAKVFYHYTQHIGSGKFEPYKHFIGASNPEDDEKYERLEYNVTNIVAPIIIFRAQNDPLSTEEDIKTLLGKFSTNTRVIYETVAYDKFNHADFVLAKDVEKFVYYKLLKILRGFQ